MRYTNHHFLNLSQLKVFLLVIFSISCFALNAQQLSNWRQKDIQILSDTTVLDTLSLIPSSEVLKYENGKIIPLSDYEIDFASAKLIVDKEIVGKKINIAYRVFPILFTKEYAHKNMDQIEQEDPGKYDFFTLKNETDNRDIFSVSGLNKNGSISRGVNFGNNQDLSVNSNLDLQLSGRISDDVSIQAAISDNNLPIQPEGNTQQLQEFDRVFIKLFTENSSLIAGDYRISRPKSYFMNFNKKVQGGGFSTKIITKQELNEKDNGVFKTGVNVAISRGKFSRNVINGIEGNQGPYKLQGDENERFIIILSGTERVFVNGRLMKRGQNNDYVIDYNTAELTFTPNQIINKDQRIVVEFQYSEQNYARSVIFLENSYQKEKLRLDFNVYSEQDSKNQPLQQDLNVAEKLLLDSIGDNLDNAVISGIDTAGFDNDQVRYKLIDSLGQKVLVFSKNPDSAIYAARFRLVGMGNGDYIQIQSDANGRVFQWVAPIAGVRQGDYDPSIQLVTPKKRQMMTFGAAYDFSKYTHLSVEGAFTNNDLNTFSDVDANDDQSYAVKLNLNHKQPISKSDSLAKTYWASKLFYEQRGRNFQFVERYRDVEFERDWNILGTFFQGNEYLIRAQTGLTKKQNFINYEFGSFIKGIDYEGIKNGYSANLKKGGFSVQSKGSFLTTKSINNSEFLRHYTTVSQEISGFKVGGYLEQERVLFKQGKSDTLNVSSLDRRIWKAFIELGDSASTSQYKLSYGESYDFLPNGEALNFAQKSENAEFDFKYSKNRNSRWSGKIINRRFLIRDSELSSRKAENTLLGKIQYDLKALKGFVNSNTFYQIGSGQENKREFSFLEVNDGQGTHLWNDYNGNGIKELNEFEVAGGNNNFQANYIKVFTPTNDFIRVFSNQFNQVLFLKPNALVSGEKGWKRWLGKFSNKAAYRAERKTTLEDDIYNPFKTDVSDTNLISIQSSFANTFYFNRINPKFGMEYFYLNNTGKNLLTSGFESRRIIQNEVRTRYNVNRIYSVELRLTDAQKDNRSEFFANRDFTILKQEIEPKIIYQPSVKFRLTFSAIYADKKNDLGDETSINRSVTANLRYNQVGKGTFSMSASYIDIVFNSAENSSLAFEMLEGLTAGGNITWEVLWQRNLANNLQLNLNYGGRKSNSLKVIHTGGMQIRAYF